MTLQSNYSYYSLEKNVKMCCFKQTFKYFLKIKARMYHLKKPFYGLFIFFAHFFFIKIYVSNIFNRKILISVYIRKKVTSVSASHLQYFSNQQT